MKQFFFNDAEVTEAVYNELLNGVREPEAPSRTFHIVKDIDHVEPKVKTYKGGKIVTPKVAKVAKAKPITVANANGKSKIDQAIEIVKELKDSLLKEQIITTLMLKLGDITKGNANIYYQKALVRLA